HPVAAVERDWVTPDHREAAKAFIQFMLDRPQQQKTLEYGFHPGDVNVGLGSPLDAAHGVDPKEPKTTLEVPSVDVMDSIIKLWHEHKKHANLVLVFDTSGSMRDNAKMPNAQSGAKQLIALLDDRDYLSILPFNTTFGWAGQNMMVQRDREAAARVVDSFYPQGETALYDSIDEAYRFLQTGQRGD